MARSSTSKGKRAAKPERLPSPAPSSSSSSASPSSKGADSDSDSSSSGSGSDRESSASPEPVAVAQPRRDRDPEALSVHQHLSPFTLVCLLVADSLVCLCSKYTPPDGFKQVKATAVASGIDWDQIKEDADLELWTVRVPAGVSSDSSVPFHGIGTTSDRLLDSETQVKTKHLDGLTLTLPDGDLADPVQPVGTFTAKKAEYNVYLASASSATTSSKRRRDEQEDEGAAASGQGPAGELQTLVPLLPRKSQGNKLFQGERKISYPTLPRSDS